MWGERSLLSEKRRRMCGWSVCVLENKHAAEGPPVAVILVKCIGWRLLENIVHVCVLLAEKIFPERRRGCNHLLPLGCSRGMQLNQEMHSLD